ncbi:Predicted arabinose efflux permease, MFS family [Glycomyces sambucus]|uniref:Predicted arabinose efflux permease, MFS family n=1 Tax=Glycomyces sambucus TaxID=380244 RepID=A0A1G9FXL3_9ACTN|nr:MFS transporter [Glycomyces sambucus]SDK93134.1 Predicted arabinose efflux permease, MFS family [Glycomyces sambucus]
MRLDGSFWRFWTAMVLANIGDGIRIAAFPLLAASLSQDPFTVAAVGAAAVLPWLLTGVWAGVLADRHHARTLLLATDLTRIGVLAALVATLLTGHAQIAVVVAAAFALGVGETVRDTVAQTVVPRLVPAALIERANSRMVSGEVVGNEFAGPLIGGALFGLGAVLPFAVNSGALAIGVLLLTTIPAVLLTRPAAATTARAVRAADGLVWLWRHRTLRRIVATSALVAFADAAWFATFVLFAGQRLGLGASGFGVLLAVGACGGLAGAWTADRLVGGGRHVKVLIATGAAIGLTPMLLLAAPDLWSAVAVVLVTSAAFGVFNVAVTSLRHRLVPPELLGRTVAASRTVVLGTEAVGALAGGLVASVYGLDAPFLLSAAFGLAGIALWLRRSARGGLPEPA